LVWASTTKEEAMKIILLILLSVSLWGNIGSVMAFKGSAEIVRQGQSIEVKNGTDVKQKDEIKTKDNSRVQVMLKDDTVVTIGANSSFSFEEFSQEADKEKVSMRANFGFFRSVSGKIGKVAPERFKVKTASATIGIRGTDFSGNISADKETFRCYDGAIVVEYDGGVKELEPGMMIEISSEKVEVKEFSVEKKEQMDSGVVEQESQVSVDEIADIVQNVEDNKDPFNFEPIPQDRPQKY
jgi:ferric-dicitrate binding protein FerR (iron transport regulator)